MNAMVRSSPSIAWLAGVLILVAGCELLAPSEEPYAPITGRYVATTYTSPGPADGLVDVLAESGSLDVDLRRDGTVSGHLVDMTADTCFTGRFEIEGDTVWFREAPHPLTVAPWVWDRERGEFETVDLEGWMALFKIVLERRTEDDE